MKKRHISPNSKQIIKLLKRGVSSRKIERMGYSRSTIRYNKYKLFNQKQYKAVLKRGSKYYHANKRRKSK